MIGFRGASRYYDERYREAFALECAAIWRVREEMGLTNVKVMIPFCRTLEEGSRVLRELAQNGLIRGQHGLEVYVMCEIPNNVILAEEFSESVRRLLDRLQRSDAARSGSGPRLRTAGQAFRRAGSRGEAADPNGDRSGPQEGSSGGNLRAGAERLSRIRGVPGAASGSIRSRSTRTRWPRWRCGSPRVRRSAEADHRPRLGWKNSEEVPHDTHDIDRTRGNCPARLRVGATARTAAGRHGLRCAASP